MRSAVSLACLLLSAAGAEPAAAVRIEVTPAAVVYTAGPNELNRLSVGAGEGATFRLLDSSDVFPGAVSAPVDAVEPCRVIAGGGARAAIARAAVLHGAPTIVECPARPEIVATLGDHADAAVLDEGVVT